MRMIENENSDNEFWVVSESGYVLLRAENIDAVTPNHAGAANVFFTSGAQVIISVDAADIIAGLLGEGEIKNDDAFPTYDPGT